MVFQGVLENGSEMECLQQYDKTQTRGEEDETEEWISLQEVFFRRVQSGKIEDEGGD